MAEVRATKIEQGQIKVKNVPIAVTPEGFWCCPSPVVFQKTLKPQNPLNKPKPASPPHKSPPVQKKPTLVTDKKPTLTRSRSGATSDDERKGGPHSLNVNAPDTTERMPRPKVENVPRKVAIEFGEPGTSNMKVILLGKQGFCVKLNVHRNVLIENSSFFSEKILERESGLSWLQIDDCDEIEIYVETVGLMYCKDIRQRLIKQSVSRVLRILKVAELLGFKSCLQSCLEYLEAVPWVGEEEEKVISSVSQLQDDIIKVTPVLKRISSDASQPHHDTLSHIIELVLKSNAERGRREMKLVVLKLLRENNSTANYTGSPDICNETIYSSCGTCLTSLLSQFKHAAEPGFPDKPTEIKEPIVKQIALQADNLTWLLEILADRRVAEEFAAMWASQSELANIHSKLSIVSRYHISCITARLLVRIGKGEVLPLKDTRLLLLSTWLEPLINDYSWLQYGCRSFDRKVVEEGIGRTILTLPLEDQQSILLSWLGIFLKSGDNCPNLQKAFEVWWRRTFVRPQVETQGSIIIQSSDSSRTSQLEN